MAPVPAPSPAPTPGDFLSAVGAKWGKLQFILDWFVRLVDTAYGYSDMIIAHRQNKANQKYKTQKAEEEAYRLKEQSKGTITQLVDEEEGASKVRKRSVREIDDQELMMDILDELLEEEAIY